MAVTGYKKALIPDVIRRAVAVAAGAIPGQDSTVPCHYCGQVGQIIWGTGRRGLPFSYITATPGLDVDHVIPERLGGLTTLENLVMACRRCNRSKGSRV